MTARMKNALACHTYCDSFGDVSRSLAKRSDSLQNCVSVVGRLQQPWNNPRLVEAESLRSLIERQDGILHLPQACAFQTTPVDIHFLYASGCRKQIGDLIVRAAHLSPGANVFR